MIEREDLCIRCGMDRYFKSRYCLDCSKMLDRVVERWMDSGELTGREFLCEVSLTEDALYQRISRARKKLGIPRQPAWGF